MKCPFILLYCMFCLYIFRSQKPEKSTTEDILILSITIAFICSIQLFCTVCVESYSRKLKTESFILGENNVSVFVISWFEDWSILFAFFLWFITYLIVFISCEVCLSFWWNIWQKSWHFLLFLHFLDLNILLFFLSISVFLRLKMDTNSLTREHETIHSLYIRVKCVDLFKSNICTDLCFYVHYCIETCVNYEKRKQSTCIMNVCIDSLSILLCDSVTCQSCADLQLPLLEIFALKYLYAAELLMSNLLLVTYLKAVCSLCACFLIRSWH